MKNKKFKPSFRITDRTNEHAAKYLSTALIIFKLRLGKIIKAIGEYSIKISQDPFQSVYHDLGKRIIKAHLCIQ
jgi:hypothetical protein